MVGRQWAVIQRDNMFNDRVPHHRHEPQNVVEGAPRTEGILAGAGAPVQVSQREEQQQYNGVVNRRITKPGGRRRNGMRTTMLGNEPHIVMKGTCRCGKK